MGKIITKVLIALSIVAAISGCSDGKAYQTSICALADVSGTYVHEKKGVTKIIRAGILPEMLPGDSLFFIKIDSNSYSEENLETKITFDYKPTEANKQKLSFSNALDKFSKGKARSRHTDISGAMMLCADYLKDTQAGTQAMFIFSDMKEELPANVVRKFKPKEFTGMHIAAMNVIKLNKDSENPEVYRKRLKKWDKRITDSGAKSWHTLIDATKIPEFINNIRG